MVGDTLKSKAPEPDEMSDRVSFLLKAAQRLAEGIPVLKIFDQLGVEAATEQVRQAVKELSKDLRDGKSISASLGKHPNLFPPMVIWLIDMGETFGEVDVTMRMAGQWLRNGKYRVAPHVFTGATFYRLRQAMKKAKADGAVALIIDTRRTEPLSGAKTRPEVVWMEREMPDGAREKAFHVGSPGHLPEYLTHLRMLTVLDEYQEGDALTGTLQMRLCAQDGEEAEFPVAYQPFRDGEEVRISIRP